MAETEPASIALAVRPTESVGVVDRPLPANLGASPAPPTGVSAETDTESPAPVAIPEPERPAPAVPKEPAPKEPPATKEREAPAKEATPKEAAPPESPTPDEEPAPLPVTVQRLVPRLRKSARLFAEGKKLIPNSSSSLIRVASYDPCPPFIARGRGARIWDVDDNEYLDFNLSYGVLINGHAHPAMVKAIQEQAELGLHFAAPTELEIEVARQFVELVPSAERVAFCSNGSDATMNAIRIARAVTGKDSILKFEGHYHGQHDYALISSEAPPIVAGLDEYPRPLPNSAGIPPGVMDYVNVAPYNSITAFERIVKRNRDKLAAVILEPVMANAGVIPPDRDFLKRVREITRENEMLLIFDEVFTGFRIAAGGAQSVYHVEPDLSCWAKALGGGMPISAVSGKAEYMDLIAPGRISFGGTYFANSLTLAGTLANLKLLDRGGKALYERFARMTERMEKGIEQAARDAKVSVLVQSVPGMLQFFFTKRKKITNYRESLQIDWDLYLRHHQLLLEKGIYIHPDNYERLTFSSTHTDKDVDTFVATMGETLAELKSIPRDALS